MFWKNKPDLDCTVALKRKALKFTQAELATMCGVTRQTIIAVEKGNYVPSVALALGLAKALQTTVENLFIIGKSS